MPLNVLSIKFDIDENDENYVDTVIQINGIDIYSERIEIQQRKQMQYIFVMR